MKTEAMATTQVQEEVGERKEEEDKTTTPKKEKEEEDEELNPRDAMQFRSISARINYISADRPDVQFACKSASKYMATTTNKGWAVLKRVVKYIKGRPRLIQRFPWEGMSQDVNAYADSD